MPNGATICRKCRYKLPRTKGFTEEGRREFWSKLADGLKTKNNSYSPSPLKTTTRPIDTTTNPATPGSTPDFAVMRLSYSSDTSSPTTSAQGTTPTPKQRGRPRKSSPAQDSSPASSTNSGSSPSGRRRGRPCVRIGVHTQVHKVLNRVKEEIDKLLEKFNPEDRSDLLKKSLLLSDYANVVASDGTTDGVAYRVANDFLALVASLPDTSPLRAELVRATEKSLTRTEQSSFWSLSRQILHKYSKKKTDLLHEIKVMPRNRRERRLALRRVQVAQQAWFAKVNGPV